MRSTRMVLCASFAALCAAVAAAKASKGECVTLPVIGALFWLDRLVDMWTDGRTK